MQLPLIDHILLTISWTLGPLYIGMTMGWLILQPKEFSPVGPLIIGIMLAAILMTLYVRLILLANRRRGRA